MRTLIGSLVLVALVLGSIVGCSNSENAGPASQADVNNLTKDLKNTQTSAPDVPIELRNKGMSPGQGITGIQKGGH